MHIMNKLRELLGTELTHLSCKEFSEFIKELETLLKKYGVTL